MEAFRPVLSANGMMRRATITSRYFKRNCQCQYQQLHSSAPRAATPGPIAEAPGPPPSPPQPAASHPDDRVLRKRRQAEMLQRGRELKANPSRPSTTLQKRFWKSASVKDTPDGLQIHLDIRPVRTATKNVLAIPHNKPQLATAIALEWDLLVSAQQALKQHHIPLTALTSRAIDIENDELRGDGGIRSSIIGMLMRYLHTDTLLCWAPEIDIHGPKHEDVEAQRESLQELQMNVAQPIIAYLTTKVWPGVKLYPILDKNSFKLKPQPIMTQEVIKSWTIGLPAFELAGLERAVLASKSLLVAVRLLVEWSQEFAQLRMDENPTASRFSIEEAAQACSLEVNWQTRMWGEVEDTHDVEKEDLRRQLGGVVMLISGET